MKPEDACTMFTKAVDRYGEENDLVRHQPNGWMGRLPKSTERGITTYTGFLKDVSRDVFYSPDTLAHKCLLCLEDMERRTSGAERTHVRDVMRHFRFGEASLLLNDCWQEAQEHNPTETHVVHDIWVGHLGQGWILSFFGTYQNHTYRHQHPFDIEAHICLTVGMTQTEAEHKVSARIEQWARRVMQQLAGDVTKTERLLPQNMQQVPTEALTYEMKQHRSLFPLESYVQRKQLMDAIGWGDDGHTKEPRKL